MEEFDFVALRIGVQLIMAVSLDKATGTARLDSKGFRLIGPGLSGIGTLHGILNLKCMAGHYAKIYMPVTVIS